MRLISTAQGLQCSAQGLGLSPVMIGQAMPPVAPAAGRVHFQHQPASRCLLCRAKQGRQRIGDQAKHRSKQSSHYQQGRGQPAHHLDRDSRHPFLNVADLQQSPLRPRQRHGAPELVISLLTDRTGLSGLEPSLIQPARQRSIGQGRGQLPLPFAAESQRTQVTVDQQQLATRFGRGNFQRKQHRQRRPIAAAKNALQLALQITHRHDILKLQLQARITGTHPGLSDRLALCQ